MRSTVLWRGAFVALVMTLTSSIQAQSPNVGIPVPTNATGMRVKTYNPNVLSFGPGAVTPAGGPSGTGAILYAPSEADDPAYRAAISAATGGLTVDYFDASAGTPDMTLLMNYDCVYTWANFAYADAVLFGDNLAAFNDIGGTVILGAFCTYTSGNSLSGLIMTPAYCPVVSPLGNNHFLDDNYDGSGVDCPHSFYGVVSAYNCLFRDFLTLQGTGTQDGAYVDGEIATAINLVTPAGAAVVYTNGCGAVQLGCGGEWALLVANSSGCGGPPPCCGGVTGLMATDLCPDIQLNWAGPALGDPHTERRVLRNGTLIFTDPTGTATSYTDTGLAAGVYTYTIEADCACGSSLASPSVTVVHCPTVRVLYAPSEADDAAYRSSIAIASGGLVDYFDARAATPDLAFLQANYDVVYTWANFGFFDAVGFGDVLGDFADGGGKVILGAFCTYTSGNSLSGRIMTDCYSPVVSPAGNNHFLDDAYDGSGVGCMYGPGSVTAMNCNFRDFLVTQGNGAVDGLYLDGEICGAFNVSGVDVHYTNGCGASQLGCGGDWGAFIGSTSLCVAPPAGCGPVAALNCVGDCGTLTISATWDPAPAGVTSIEILVNGAVEATLGAGAVMYDYVAPAAGVYSLAVRPICSGTQGCAASCSVLLCGDTCDDSIPIGEGFFPFDNTGVPLDGPTDCDIDLTGDIWYEYTATVTATVTIDTCTAGTLTDTTLIVYDASLGCPVPGSPCLASGDDECGPIGFSSQVMIPVTAGSSYYIQVGGWNGSEGDATLSVTPGEICDNGTDDDLDTLVDCDDPDCTLNPVCLPAYAGETDLVINHDGVDGDEGLILSAAALAAALTAEGQNPLVMNTDIATASYLLTEAFDRIWVCTGTFPSDGIRPNLAELDMLAAAQAAGKHVYFEGGDHWGFAHVISNLDNVDGVDQALVLDGGDLVVSLDGFDSGVGEDFSDLQDVAYNQDQAGNDWTDELQAATSATDTGINAAGRAFGPDDALLLADFAVTVLAETAAGGNMISSSVEFGGFGGDQNDLVSRYLSFFGGGGPGGDEFVRGDANRDGGIDISDAVFILSALFVPGSSSPSCPDSADTNDDGGFDISDAVFLLSALFVPGSSPPPAPNPDCGVDPTMDSLAPCPGYPFCP